MPRRPSLDLPGIPQHVVQRGNDRQPCFFADVDRQRYLQDLKEIALREGCAVHAYVLMTNHVHLLMTPTGSGQIARLMQALGRRYVRYVNDRYHRTGTLWEGRYKSSLVDRDTYLLHCYRYIELNPVRAAMCTDPADYLWSKPRLQRARPRRPAHTSASQLSATWNNSGATLRRLPRYYHGDAFRQGYPGDPVAPATPACTWIRSLSFRHRSPARATGRTTQDRAAP
jgi:REP element-mobilizing transposase RayT